MTTKIRWRVIFFWVTLFTLIYCWPTEAEQPVRIRVRPAFLLSFPDKTTFHIRWQIARHKENRHYAFSYACNTGETSHSSKQMEGENERMTWDIYRDINAGTGCVFDICVYRLKETPFACARQSVEVVHDPL